MSTKVRQTMQPEAGQKTSVRPLPFSINELTHVLLFKEHHPVIPSEQKLAMHLKEAVHHSPIFIYILKFQKLVFGCATSLHSHISTIKQERELDSPPFNSTRFAFH